MYEKELYEGVDEILKASRSFRDRIEFAKESWTFESDALSLFESQIEIMETIKDLVNKNRYIESFILNRTIFENYFFIFLMLKGTKYIRRYKIAIKSNETPKQAYNKIKEELEKQLIEGRKDIFSFKPVKKFTEIEVTHIGRFSPDMDKIIPNYYFVFQEYDPIRHRIDKIKSIALKDLFPEHLIKWQQTHAYIYNMYLGFENVLNACILNGFINKEQKNRVKVHYNFLSSFTHLTKKCFDFTNSFELRRNRHYLIELNLLYILRILRLYLLLMIDFFSNTNHKICDIKRFLNHIDKIGNKYDYFWFIFNQPTEYDFWRYQTSKEFHAKRGEFLDEMVPYYKDPLERLKGQHQSALEISTGLGYNSPWPKHNQ
jgi:hypothetical protein